MYCISLRVIYEYLWKVVIYKAWYFKNSQLLSQSKKNIIVFEGYLWVLTFLIPKIIDMAEGPKGFIHHYF